MPTLTLPKTYADTTVLFKADIDDMWGELETLVNGGIDSDNVDPGFASWAVVRLDKDTTFTLGTTDSAFIEYYDTQDMLVFGHDPTMKKVIIKVNSTTVAELATDGTFSTFNDIVFSSRNTSYPLSYLVGYKKPVLIYFDSTTILLEQNVATASTSLVVFPIGPLAVTEDLSVSSRLRQLSLNTVANGFSPLHVGAARSGVRTSIALSPNTYYFIYAVVVQGGDDATSNIFVMVLDDTSPVPDNWSTLDSRYGAGMWQYLGPIRIGHGLSMTTTMVPFVMDKSGWISFTGRASTDRFFGIRMTTNTVGITTFGTLIELNAANSGNAAPDTCSMMKITYRIVGTDETPGMRGNLSLTDNSDNVLYRLPAFSVNLEADEAHGWEMKIPNGLGLKLKARIASA